MTLEQKYQEQLEELGVYREAFLPAIRTLAQLEREYRRLDKVWRDDTEKGRPSYTSKLYENRQKLRAEILTHRESLGLTPKGFKRIRPEAATAGEAPGAEFGRILADITARCARYDDDGSSL